MWVTNNVTGQKSVVCSAAHVLDATQNLDRRRGGPAPKSGLAITLRRRTLEDGADAFHANALLGMGAVCNSLCYVQVEKEACARRLFRYYQQRGGVLASEQWTPPPMENAPVEMCEVISESNFVGQYRRLQDVQNSKYMYLTTLLI